MKYLTASLILLLQARVRTVGGAYASIFQSKTGRFTDILAALSRTNLATIRGGTSSSSTSCTNVSRTVETFVNTPTTASFTSLAHHPTLHVEDSNNDIILDSSVNQRLSKAQQAVESSLHIAGPHLSIDVFASNIPFLNTAKLTRHKQHRVLFVLGGPGAGKGTQSGNIVKTYQCVHLSVGELLRQERMRGDKSAHAELIEQCLVSGQIVPVEISLSLVRRAMDDMAHIGSSQDFTATTASQKRYGQQIFLVDGFPRNFDNLSGWASQMPEYAAVLGALVYDCPMEILEQRILSRAETSGRSDDNLISARKRFNTFQEQTMPVVRALEEVQKIQQSAELNSEISFVSVKHIAGDGTIDQVWEETQQVMNSFVQNDILTANTLLLDAIRQNDLDTYMALCSKDLLAGDTNMIASRKTDGETEKARLRRIFQQYELGADGLPMEDKILNASVHIHNGTKAVVSYDRLIKDPGGEYRLIFRETRAWSHEAPGWLCIHFIRNPST